MDNSGLIRSLLKERSDLCLKIADSEVMLENCSSAAESIIECFRNDGKVLFCGNGGSAADAQHLAAELSGRFYMDRDPLFAEALHVNTSYLTAVANDISFDQVFSRQVEAKGRDGDILIAISTSGNSPNILNAAITARNINMQVISFTGSSGGALKELSDILITIPSDDTPRIQEMHITLGHSICQIVEESLFAE
jgi:D-sedoheptulose 7-phosphate isomerase